MSSNHSPDTNNLKEPISDPTHQTNISAEMADPTQPLVSCTFVVFSKPGEGEHSDGHAETEGHRRHGRYQV